MSKNNKIFGKEYAYAYDFLYKNKNYNKECDFIQGIFKKYSLKPKTILDLGCGTGGHALILAKNGYKVTGIDRSKEMLAIAQRKARERNLNVKFINQNMEKLDVGKSYDAVISMFSVIGYLTDNSEFTKVCANVKKHLNNNGIFIFDCWNGYAVLNKKPAIGIREAWLNNKEKIIRSIEPVRDILNHTVETRFRSRRLKGNRLIKETFESHLVRFWFPQEIKYYLEVAGFRKINLCPLLGLNKQLTEHDWYMTAAALFDKGRKGSRRKLK